MIRKIVDYSKLNLEVLDLLVNKYPDGYNDDDIITFRNAQNELIEAVEIKTDDIIYLVKVGKRLVLAMEEHADDEEDNEEKEDSNEDNTENLEDIENLEDEPEDTD